MLLAPAPLSAEPTPAGAYLAARYAAMTNDFAHAEQYYALALAQDSSNARIMEEALVAFVALGDVERAVPVAQRLTELGSPSQLAGLILLAHQMHEGAFSDVVAAFARGESFSPPIDDLMYGWALLGLGRMSDAAERFDHVAATPGMQAFGLYHKALALAVVGDFEAAERLFAGTGTRTGPLHISRGALVAHAQILAQLERSDEAVTLLNEALVGSSDPELEMLRDRLASGQDVAYDFLTTAQEGASEVFFALATAVQGEAEDSHTLLYTRLAENLRADSVDIQLLVAELLVALDQNELAIAAYEKIPADHPAFYSAEIGRADALYDVGKPDAAVEALKNLAKAHPDNASVFVSLADTLRHLSRFTDAAKAYDRAIELLPQPQPNHWFVYYSRGVSRERIDDWPGAEADFRLALKLSPDQPLVLNYLGYSLVEKREHLDEALAMIETAVAARPNDGYITDSLGWVRYRLGKYPEAVAPMERAVALEPVDSVINDHLGDVYWKVGRHMEARFQWRRALSFGPEEGEAARIRRKLESGLDAVLTEEDERAVTRNGD